jgi:hypothetical protein
MNAYSEHSDKDLNQCLKDVNKAIELYGPNSAPYASLVRTQHKLRIEAMNRTGNESAAVAKSRFPNY